MLSTDKVYPYENWRQSPVGVRLSHKPTGEVTVTATSADTGVASTSPSSLTFKPSNWDQPQEVMVIAVPDSNTTDDTTTVTFSASGGNYAGVSASAAVLAYDDGQSSFTLSHARADMNFKVYEGDTGTVDIALKSAPSGTVTVTVTSPDTSAVTVDTDSATAGNQSDLSFTTSNWEQPQSFSLFGVEDADADSESFKLSLTASGGGYDDATGSMRVEVVDNDRAVLMFSQERLAVTEGSSDTFGIRLGSQPSADVTVTADIYMGSGKVTLDSTELTFTTENWSQQQTVTVTGSEDDDSNGERIYMDWVASGGGYDGQKKTVGVFVEDDDYTADPSPALVVSRSQIVMTEGTTEGISVSLATKPSQKVIVQLVEVSEDPFRNGLTISNGYPFITFSPDRNSANAWFKPQTVPVTIFDEARVMDENNGVFDILAVAWSYEQSEYTGRSTTVTVTGVDNDTPNLVVPSRIEPGPNSSETFSVKLSRRPTADVTVSIAVDPPFAVTVDKTSLTFTTATWNVAQQIEVRTNTSREWLTLTASGGGYDSVTKEVYVYVGSGGTTPAQPGLVVSRSGINITESGSESFTVALASQPTGTVTVSLSTGNATAFTLDKSSLTFTSETWNTAQTVIMTAPPDSDALGERANVTISASGGGYGNVDSADIEVRVNDDDPPGVTITTTPTAASGNITVTYDATASWGVYKPPGWRGPDKLNRVPSGHFTLKEDDKDGDDIPYTIRGGSGPVITIDPDILLPSGTIYFAVPNQYWSDSDVQGAAAETTFDIAEPTEGTPDGLVGKVIELWHITDNSSACLDVQWAGARNGQNVWTYDCNGTKAQRWKLEKRGSGTYKDKYRLVSGVGDGNTYCLDNRGDFSNSSRMGIWRCLIDSHWDVANQTVDFTASGDGYIVTFTKDQTSVKLWAERTGDNKRSNVGQRTDDATDAAIWTLVDPNG